MAQNPRNVQFLHEQHAVEELSSSSSSSSSCLSSHTVGVTIDESVENPPPPPPPSMKRYRNTLATPTTQLGDRCNKKTPTDQKIKEEEEEEEEVVYIKKLQQTKTSVECDQLSKSKEQNILQRESETPPNTKDETDETDEKQKGEFDTLESWGKIGFMWKKGDHLNKSWKQRIFRFNKRNCTLEYLTEDTYGSCVLVGHIELRGAAVEDNPLPHKENVFAVTPAPKNPKNPTPSVIDTVPPTSPETEKIEKKKQKKKRNKTSGRVYYLRAQTKTDKNEWMEMCLRYSNSKFEIRRNFEETIHFEGFLNKKGELNTSFKSRYCKLFDDRLTYYKNIKDKKPLGTIPLDGIRLNKHEQDNFSFSIGQKNIFRTYIFQAEDKHELCEWMDIIGQVLKKRYGASSKSTKETKARSCEVASLEGFLSKLGATKRGGWKKRWCVLANRRIRYYKKQSDRKHAGEINLARGAVIRKIGPEEGDYSGANSNSLPRGVAGIKMDFAFSVCPPGQNRTFVLAAATQPELEKWIQLISQAAAIEAIED